MPWGSKLLPSGCMKKMWAVLKREYIVAVRKKMFIFMTLFFPVLMAGLIVLPGLMMARGLGEKKVDRKSVV